MATMTDKKPTDAKGGKDAKGADGDGESGGKGGKKMLLMVLIGIIVALAGAGGAYVMFFKEPGPPPPPEPGAMVQMDAMTLTLAGQHFLKVQVAIQLIEGVALPEGGKFETVKASQLLIDTFSNREMDELTSNAARKDLTAELLKGLQKAYPEEVFAVFLTQFVIQ